MSLPRVGWIGAGLMGSGMARCLLDAGHPLSVVAHRNRAPVEPLIAAGAQEAQDAAALARDVDIVFTCLPNATVVQALAETIVPVLGEGQIWIDTSTSLPEVSAALAERLAGRNAIFADAPVTGGPEQAAGGALGSLVGCEDAHFAAVEAAVQPYSMIVRRFGAPGRGHAAKLLNNLVSQGTMILLADAYRAAEQLGVDRAALYDVMLAGAARSGTLEKSVAPALKGDYGGARFTIANAAKDLRYARDLLAGTGAVDPGVIAALVDRLEGQVDAGRGDAFVSTMLRRDA
ncbi:MAG: NAD(P)-dependent oxidoreductase [Pseudomonadota bacterium]